MQTNFFRGIPTRIDVDKLMKRFGVPKEGAVVQFEDAALEIGLDRDSCRFKTVFSAWRKELLNKHNVLMIATGAGSVKCAAPDERITWCAAKVRGGRRMIGRAIVVSHSTDTARLTEDNQKTRAGIVAMNDSKLRLAASVMK